MLKHPTPDTETCMEPLRQQDSVKLQVYFYIHIGQYRT